MMEIGARRLTELMVLLLLPWQHLHTSPSARALRAPLAWQLSVIVSAIFSVPVGQAMTSPVRPIGSHYIALGSINLHGDGPLLDTTHYTPSNGTLGTWSPPPHVGPVLDRAPVIVPTPYITDYSITRWNGDWQSTSHYGQWQ